MTIGVSHTFGGTVVVVDLHSGLRFDLSPEQALDGAATCEAAADRPSDLNIVVLQALDDRALRWAGDCDDLHAMARDLRKHAKGSGRQGDGEAGCERGQAA
jgi:hypothetical protein